MSIKYIYKIILLSIFVFLLITCSKKNEINKVNKSNTEEINNIGGNIITENETNNNTIYGYDDFYYRNDHEKFIGNLLLKKNKKKVDNVLDSPFHFGDTLKYFSNINLDIDKPEGETWFSLWQIFDSIPSLYFHMYLHIIKDKNIIKTDWIPVSLWIHNTHRMMSEDIEDIDNEWYNKFIRFTFLDNLPGKFFFRAWLYDVNKDGFDEIIYVPDIFSKDYPKAELEIIGFDKDKFVTYLKIEVITIDEKTGPDPVQYIQNQDVCGFRCLMDSSEYTSLYGIPSLEKDDFIWVFFTWDSNEKKYIESEYIE